MRIGLVTAEYPPAIGGVGDHGFRLARELTRLGHSVQVLTSTGGRADPHTSASAGDPLTLRVVRQWTWGILPLVQRAVREHRWDVVHIQYQPAAYGLHPAINILPWWLRRSGTAAAVVTTFHDLREPYVFPKAGSLRPWLVKQLARHSHANIAVAHEDAEQLHRWRSQDGGDRLVAWVPLGNHFDAPPPADFDRTAWRAQLGVGRTTSLLGHLGLVNRSKGIEHLVGALHRLREHGRDAQVLMIGDTVGTADATNQRYLAEVRAEAKRLGVASLMHWTGFEPRERIAGWLRCLDLAVLPFSDGPTLRRTSLIGAWSHGVPVLTTEPRQPTTWFFPERPAATISRVDATTLADAIASLLAESAHMSELAERGRAFATQFEWPAVAARTANVYRAAREIRER